MWWEIVFWLLLVPCLIILGITYGTGKKLYKLLYVLAIYTYVTLATYVIDVFSLGRNWILSILVFSAILLILIGFFMSKNSSKKKTKKKVKSKNSQKNLITTVILLVLMLALIILGSASPGLTKKIVVISKINATIFKNSVEPAPKVSPESSFTRVMTITYENNGFLSAPITEKRFTACAYDKEGQGYELYTQTSPSDYRSYEEVSPGDTKELFVNIGRIYLDDKVTYEKVIVASFNRDNYYDCSVLKNSENKATIFKEIPIIN